MLTGFFSEMIGYWHRMGRNVCRVCSLGV